MAGRGKRLRPQSSLTPKPLLAVRGKCMVERIVEGFSNALPRPATDSVFVVGPSFSEEAYSTLRDICARHDIVPHFVVQKQALGTAHAVAVAGNHLSDEGIVVYADTVFEMEPVDNLEGSDVVTWVKEVEDPSRFGVAVREGSRVVAFVEKPLELISREALIGIYYVRDLARLHAAIQVLFDNEIVGKGGEYYLTDAFDLMLKDGLVFRTAQVRTWLDCGTVEAFMDTTRYLLEHEPQDIRRTTGLGSVVIEPVHIAEGVTITDSVIGPYVSVESGAIIEHAVISNSIIFERAHVKNVVLDRSMIGANSIIDPGASVLNVGDFGHVQ